MAKIFLVAEGNNFIAAEQKGDDFSILFDENQLHTNGTNIPLWNGEPLMREGDIIEHVVENLEYLKDVVWDPVNGDIKFIYQNNSEFTIRVPTLDIIDKIEYNHDTTSIVLTKKDGTPISVDVGELVDKYVGSEESEIKIEVVDNEIRAILLEGEVTWEHLTEELQDRITNLESSVDDLEGSITDINEEVTNIQSNITQIKEDIINLEEDVTAVEDDIERIDDVIDNLKYVTEVTQPTSYTIDFIFNKPDTVVTVVIPEPEEVDLSPVEDRLTVIEGDIVDIDDKLTEIYDTFDNIRNDIGNIDDRVTVVESDVEDAQTFFDELEYIRHIDYDEETNDITVVFHDDREDLVINVPHSEIIEDIEYRHDSNTIVLIKNDEEKSEITVRVEDLVDIYEGSIGDEIQILIDGNEIQAKLLFNVVTHDHLAEELKEKVDEVVVTDVTAYQGTLEVTYSNGREEEYYVYPTFCSLISPGSAFDLTELSVDSEVIEIRYSAVQPGTDRYETGMVSNLSGNCTAFNIVKTHEDRDAFIIQDGFFVNQTDHDVKLSGIAFPLDLSCE